MKILVGFRDSEKAVGTLQGAEVTWEGDGAAEVRALFDQLCEGMEPQNVFRSLPMRLRGMWWAAEVEEGADAGG